MYGVLCVCHACFLAPASYLQLDSANILPDDEQLRLEEDLKELEQ